MKHSVRIASIAAFALSILLGAASGARAESSIGLRGGMSIDPDQILIGAHYVPPAIANNLYAVPSAELGFGDDAFTVSMNGDLQYRFASQSQTRPYAGGGLSIYYIDVDNFGSDTEFGVNLLGGLLFDRKSGAPLFLEAKIGLTDQVPDWKFLVGLMFR